MEGSNRQGFNFGAWKPLCGVGWSHLKRTKRAEKLFPYSGAQRAELHAWQHNLAAELTPTYFCSIEKSYFRLPQRRLFLLNPYHSSMRFTIFLYLQKTLWQISQKCISFSCSPSDGFLLCHHPLSVVSLAVLSAVYNWHSEGEGHKRVHLAAWWCAELCQEAPSDVPAGATFRRTPPFVQEDHRLYTHGCTHDPRLGWTTISCIIYGHRSVWMSSVVWHLCITLPFDSWLKRQKFSLGLVFY